MELGRNIGMYRKMIEYLQDTTSPHLAVIGFMGSPFRDNGVWLMMRVDYYTDDHIEPVSEYVCIEHDGYAKDLAARGGRVTPCQICQICC